MSEVVYTSRVRLEREQGPLRTAYLPGEPKPVIFSVHSEIARHYGADPKIVEEHPHATTLDYIVAALGG